VKRIVQEFKEVDGPFARYCHLMRNDTIYQINYDANKLYNSQQLFLANPDQSTSMSKFSFRVIFIDYIID
jgi:hypothetical protein